MEQEGSSGVTCKICGATSLLFGETDVLSRYRAKYFRCKTCGFIQTEAPYWLDAAYSSAIASQDVGIMQRNALNCEITSAVLNLLLPKASKAVDFGAGHGIFVRMMRDRGFDFHWSDLHASNDYARTFEYEEGAEYDLVTAFEVLEHLANPLEDLAKLMAISSNVFVSTCTVPQPVPALNDWWYYMPSSGQHIAFYTTDSLQIIARRFGRQLLTRGSYHLFTKERMSYSRFRLATDSRTVRWINRLHRRPSLVQSDFSKMTGTHLG